MVSLQFDWLAKAILLPHQTLKESVGQLILWMTTWNFPSTKVTMSVASMGLAIGLVVTLLSQVLTQPARTIAVPAFFSQEHTGPMVDLLTLFGSKYQVGTTQSVADFYKLPRNQVAAVTTAGRPTENQAIQLLVGATHPSASSLSKLELGDEVQLIGDNNGRYSYQLIATKLVSPGEASQLDPHGASLYVVVAQGVASQRLLVLLFN